MIAKILKIIDSCKSVPQIETCSAWLDVIEITHDDKLVAIGAMELKLKQFQDHGYAKRSGENRFPTDDEHVEK